MLIISKEKTSHFEIIKKCSEILKNNGLVVAPSDTVYGLITDATNRKSVEKLIIFKNRPIGKPISVFVKNLFQAKNVVYINKSQEEILKKLLPGPFTIVLPSKHRLVRLLESEKGTLGFRIPDYSFINQLVNFFGRPLTATSANISGRGPHYSIDDFLKTLSLKKKQLIDMIIDFGRLPRNKPSTVIDLTDNHLKILRKGDLNLKTTNVFISYRPSETKKIAQFILKKNIGGINKKPLVFLIEGEFGVGKTIFVKGLGNLLGVKDIISPSFVVYYEYKIKNPLVKHLYHIDFYMIEEQEEFKTLRIEEFLKSYNLIAIEWGQKSGKIINLIKNAGNIIYVKMEYLSQKERRIEISN